MAKFATRGGLKILGLPFDIGEVHFQLCAASGRPDECVTQRARFGALGDDDIGGLFGTCVTYDNSSHLLPLINRLGEKAASFLVTFDCWQVLDEISNLHFLRTANGTQ